MDQPLDLQKEKTIGQAFPAHKPVDSDIALNFIYRTP